MRGYIKLSLILIVAMIFVVGCGNNDGEKEEQPVNDIEVQENEIEESDEVELVLSETTIDLSEIIDEIRDFYNTVYFSDVDFLDQEEGIAEI